MIKVMKYHPSRRWPETTIRLHFLKELAVQFNKCDSFYPNFIPVPLQEHIDLKHDSQAKSYLPRGNFVYVLN